MDSKIKSKAKQLSARRRLKQIMAKLAVALSCVAVFCVVYVLLAPGLTAEWPLQCGLEEHVHDEHCYTLVEPEPAAPALICGLEETEGHQHSDECYTAVPGALLCAEPDCEHSEECCAWALELTCSLEETEGHQHSDECRSAPEDGEAQSEPYYELTCGREEHSHSDSCYIQTEDKTAYACGFLTEHSHKEDCYFESGALKCTIPEHIHDDSCLPQDQDQAEDQDEAEAPIFPEALPEGYVQAEVFDHTAVFAMELDAAPAEETGDTEPETLVYVPEDAFDRPVLFVPQPVYDEEEIQALADALTEAGVAFDGMTALDLSFLDEDGEAQEPGTGPVYVKLSLPQTLPEEAEPQLHHMTGDGPELLPADVDYDPETEILTLGFAVDSFSSFTVTWTEKNSNHPLYIAYWNDSTGKEITVSADPFTTVNAGNNLDNGTGSGNQGKTARAYIEANVPDRYELVEYQIEENGKRITVDNVSYNPGAASSGETGDWHYTVNGSAWYVWHAGETPTLYVVLKRDSSAIERQAVMVYLNKSILTLKPDGTYDGTIDTDASHYTNAIDPTITINGSTKYYTYLNDYDEKSEYGYTVPLVHKDVIANAGTANAAYFVTGQSGNPDASQTSDINTRKLGTEEGFTLTDADNHSQNYQLEKFPEDEAVFAWIRENYDAEKNKIFENGVEVPKESVTSDNYAIRWLSLKYNVGDYWHLDGVLVKKNGHLVVSKTFSGDSKAIAAIKGGPGANAFYISVAEYSESGNETDLYRLYLDRVERRQSDGSYAVLAGVTPTVSADQLTYTWPLDTANTKYHIMEKNYTYNSGSDQVSKDISTVTEYRFSNLDDKDRDEAHNENWITFISDPGLTLTGRSYPSDVTADQWQTVHFRNRYLPANAMILHTVDADSNDPLPNVEFRVTANGEPLTLWYMDDAYYLYRPQGYDGMGSIQMRSTATVNEAGELVFGGVGQEETKGIAYELTELSRPAGYSEASLQFTIEDSGAISQSDEQKLASINAKEVEAVGRGNVYITTLRHTPEKAEITASKTWDDGEKHNKDTVTLTLLQNGVSTGASLTLDRKNSWTGSFGSGFPVYGPNGKLDYSIRETVNGQPADLYYVVTVARTDTVRGGKTTGIHLEVKNSKSDNAGSFAFTKVNERGHPLSGAVFTLYADSGCTTSLAALRSGEDGMVSSDLLPQGSYYLRETKAPEGYNCSGLTYTVEIQGKDSFTIHNAEGNAKTGYRIVNRTSFEMPSTGGSGLFPLYALGAGLSLLALALLRRKKFRNKRS